MNSIFEGVPMMLVATKSDLRNTTKDGKRRVEPLVTREEMEATRKNLGFQCAFETSAVEGHE